MASQTLCTSISSNDSASFQSINEEEDIQFEVESVYQGFVDTCPTSKATPKEVSDWIRSWFDVSGAFISDVGLQIFLNQIELSGFLLHNVQNKKTLFDYLDEDCNKCRDGRIPLYTEEVMQLLVCYIWFAREEKVRRDQDRLACTALKEKKNNGYKGKDTTGININEIASRSPYKESSPGQKVQRLISPMVRTIPSCENLLIYLQKDPSRCELS